jgi:2-hydroxycyclohexanecarboxyl-CoA dehydrogenase
VALVTGAAGTVASAIVERLQVEGFSVGTMDEQAGPGDLALAVELADRAQTKAAVDRMTRELGPISVLVTAPWFHDAAPFGQMSPDRWQRLLMTHLGGTVNACAAVVPSMVKAGYGTVVTVSSWLALAGVPGEAYYAAATGSILAFTKSFAVEVARHGVRVNGIAVGPLDRGVRMADIAETVTFLVRDGDFFVGQVLTAANGAVV